MNALDAKTPIATLTIGALAAFLSIPALMASEMAPQRAPLNRACILQTAGVDRLPVLHDLGEKTIEDVAPHQFWFSLADGDLRDDVKNDRRTDTLNFDGLYRLSSDKGVFHFRSVGQAYIDGRTFLYQVEWDRGMRPPAGRYSLEAIANPEIERDGPELTLVGDSITWWNDGRRLRCLIKEQGGDFTFLGSRIDPFGFHHEGEGGNNTSDILARIEHIQPSDNYFLLAGTNDRSSAEETVARIDEIAQALAAKKPGAQVLVSTLLSRQDEYGPRNEAVNAALKNHAFGCKNCRLVDLGGRLQKKPEWASGLRDDKLHPNENGYQLIAAELADILQETTSGQ